MRRVRIAIIGAGFAGLGMGIRLRQCGIEDFEILERADDIGGTWRDNSYPGCAVDVQSHLYSFSFAPNPDWSQVYAPQAEIWAYIRGCAERFGVLPHVRYGHEVTAGHWDDARQEWRIETAGGELAAQFLISGMGPLSHPAVPDIPGLDTFEGTAFHSARWDHDHDITGERVAVIGTGASAAQIVPEIQPKVARLVVFQRTPPWTFPRMNRRITGAERAVYRRWPAVQRAVRGRQYLYRESIAFNLQKAGRSAALEHAMRLRLRLQVSDPELRRKLTPSYRMGCKRIIVSDDFHKVLARPNVDVVTDGIAEVRARSIVARDGTEHPVDTIVLATGFRVLTVADPLRGRDGVPLAERWTPRREAYLGTTVAGYPNTFLLIGPNTATGHTSALLYLEEQIEHVIKAVRHVERQGMRSIEPRAEVQRAWNDDLRRRLEGSVWLAGGCASWYLDADGGTSALWPGYTRRFRRALRDFRPDDYVLRAAEPAAQHQVAAT